jgi:protoheme IX farnesyltransferase
VLKLVLNLFKLRIGLVISFTALAGVTSARGAGPMPGAWNIAVLALCVLVSSAAAGAFNQYVERDLDQKMKRTRGRPFVTGALKHGPFWLWLIGGLVAGSTAIAWFAINPISALYVFLGAFFYAIVYTVWLKRRTWLNIVVGGLAGSFAVLAGATAVSPDVGTVPLLLALVLFLWTPPHFWSLAIACREDYAAANIPMLPIVIGDKRTSKVILAHTVLLVAISLAPAWLGMGPVYLACAGIGGALFIWKNLALVIAPGRNTALACFFASLAQLTLVLCGVLLDAWL